jgi:hypothetical protein
MTKTLDRVSMREKIVSICCAKILWDWYFQVIAHKTTFCFRKWKLLSEGRYLAVHSFPFVSAVNIINANGTRPSTKYFFVHDNVKIPNLLEIILYLPINLSFNFCQSRRRVKNRQLFTTWKVAIILLAYIFMQQAQSVFETVAPETRLVVIYIFLEVTLWDH